MVSKLKLIQTFYNKPYETTTKIDAYYYQVHMIEKDRLLYNTNRQTYFSVFRKYFYSSN